MQSHANFVGIEAAHCMGHVCMVYGATCGIIAKSKNAAENGKQEVPKGCQFTKSLLTRRTVVGGIVRSMPLKNQSCISHGNSCKSDKIEKVSIKALGAIANLKAVPK